MSPLGRVRLRGHRLKAQEGVCRGEEVTEGGDTGGITTLVRTCAGVCHKTRQQGGTARAEQAPASAIMLLASYKRRRKG